jgi:hypothetical protein
MADNFDMISGYSTNLSDDSEIRINNFYRNFWIELRNIIDVYSAAEHIKPYLPELYVVRMVRTVTSVSDTSHIIIVLDFGEDLGERKFILLRKTSEGLEVVVNSKKTIVDRINSGRIGDMLLDIHTDNDLFTIVVYHGGNWAHGEEFTFGKRGESFELMNGAGFEVTDFSTGVIFNDVFFFEQGTDIKDMIYGEIPEIFVNYENLTSEDAEKYFEYL